MMSMWSNSQMVVVLSHGNGPHHLVTGERMPRTLYSFISKQTCVVSIIILFLWIWAAHEWRSRPQWTAAYGNWFVANCVRAEISKALTGDFNKHDGHKEFIGKLGHQCGSFILLAKKFLIEQSNRCIDRFQGTYHRSQGGSYCVRYYKVNRNYLP